MGTADGGKSACVIMTLSAARESNVSGKLTGTHVF